MPKFTMPSIIISYNNILLFLCCLFGGCLSYLSKCLIDEEKKTMELVKKFLSFKIFIQLNSIQKNLRFRLDV